MPSRPVPAFVIPAVNCMVFPSTRPCAAYSIPRPIAPIPCGRKGSGWRYGKFLRRHLGLHRADALNLTCRRLLGPVAEGHPRQAFWEDGDEEPDCGPGAGVRTRRT